MHPQVSPSPLRRALDELDGELLAAGWGQPTRLFALVPSDVLITEEPAMAADLSLLPGTLTALEQEGFSTDVPVTTMLSGIAWPAAVVGAAVAVERLVLPADAEASLAGSADSAETAAEAAEHPDATEVRMLVALLRDGSEEALVRVAGHDEPVRSEAGESLVPALAEALAASLRPEPPGRRQG